MLNDTGSKTQSADIEYADTCPRCNRDTYVGTAQFTSEPPAQGEVDSESCDHETLLPQQSYNVEEF